MNTSVEDKLKKTPGLVKETGSEEETLAIARSLGSHLRPGDWIALTGELGTGKSLFVRGLGEALRCAGPICSPTFVITQTYKSSGPKGIPLQHVDLYRLSHLEIRALDWQELLSEERVTAVEWAEKAQDYWPENCLVLRLTHLGPVQRKLEFFPFGDRATALLQTLKKAVKS